MTSRGGKADTLLSEGRVRPGNPCLQGVQHLEPVAQTVHDPIPRRLMLIYFIVISHFAKKKKVTSVYLVLEKGFKFLL